MRDRSSRSGPLCAGRGAEARPAHRWKPAWSWPAAAAPSAFSPERRRSCEPPAGRPRRAARFGHDALTASEQRVAQLAAGGATNPEIAQELYASLKTIETHLSHA